MYSATPSKNTDLSARLTYERPLFPPDLANETVGTHAELIKQGLPTLYGYIDDSTPTHPLGAGFSVDEFLCRFWEKFGGSMFIWGGFPKVSGVSANHLDARLQWANCSFFPNGNELHFRMSCELVLHVIRGNLGNQEMHDRLESCISADTAHAVTMIAFSRCLRAIA